MTPAIFRKLLGNCHKLWSLLSAMLKDMNKPQGSGKTSGHYDQISKIEEMRVEQRQRMLQVQRIRQAEQSAYEATPKARPTKARRKTPAARS